MKLFSATVLVCAAARAFAAAPAVDWSDAPRCAGRLCTVRGTVVAQEDVNGVIRLYFDRERRDISVVLVRSLFATWPNYVGQEIAVTGMVRTFRKIVEVVARRPRDIAVAGVATPGAVEAPTPKVGAGAPTPQAVEVERLQHRVEELEGRVRELEGGAK
jgi:hypothetical protein